MILSPSLLLGLLVLVAAELWLQPLPGQRYPLRWLWFLVALPLPWALAAWTGQRLRATVRRRGPGEEARRSTLTELAIRSIARLQALAVPVSCLILVWGGGITSFAEDLAGESTLRLFALLLVPLFAMEIGLRLIERRHASWLADRGVRVPRTWGGGWVRMTVFVGTVILLFAAAADLAETDRTLAVLLRATALGNSLGLLVAALLLSAALPLLFRVTMPTRRALPFQVADRIRLVAEKLSFPPQQILRLDTDYRLVNAALVGPFRWPRYLVLTDGILACLEHPRDRDADALSGVVAHEVGHARAAHPAWLLLVFGVIPILLIQPVLGFDWNAVPLPVLVGIGAMLAALAFFCLRRLMHRFELEADQLSAKALGGARHCIAALREIGNLFPSHRGRASFRHPSEDRRVHTLLEYEGDPAFRARFERAGRRLRVAILVVVTLALGVSVWSHARTWPLDDVVLRLYTGDFAGAERRTGRIDPAPAGADAELAAIVAKEAHAAFELMGAGGPWEEVRTPLADRSWDRALDVVNEQGAEAALPWFGLATVDGRDAVRQCALLWSEAETSGDARESERIRRHMLSLPGLPERLEAVLTDAR